MKGLIVFAACLLPAAAFAQQSYTNADLAKFQVPGAYTNEDLKRLSPLPMQRATTEKLPPYVEPEKPTAAFQAAYDNIRFERDALKDELAYEVKRVEFSESAFAGDSQSFDVRLGYRGEAKTVIQELTKRVDLLDRRLEAFADEARKAGVSLDRR